MATACPRWHCGVQWSRSQAERGVNSPIVILSSDEKQSLDTMVNSIREETGLDIQAREGRPESADDLKMVSAQDAHNIIIMCAASLYKNGCSFTLLIEFFIDFISRADAEA